MAGTAIGRFAEVRLACTACRTLSSGPMLPVGGYRPAGDGGAQRHPPYIKMGLLYVGSLGEIEASYWSASSVVLEPITTSAVELLAPVNDTLRPPEYSMNSPAESTLLTRTG
jgi:hypothetical protein